MQGTSRGRWIAVGTLCGVVAAWGGLGLAGAAGEATLTTCTKTATGKTKLITTSTQSAACTKKGKGTVTTWVPGSQLTAAQAANAQLVADNIQLEKDVAAVRANLASALAALKVAAKDARALCTAVAADPAVLSAVAANAGVQAGFDKLCASDE
jgi:hypothetical protein